jgi:(2Fe-2S) ferredoxin
MPKPERQVLVCLNARPPGNPRGCCADKQAQAVLDALKDRVRDSGLADRVMVIRTGCLKHCSRGVAVAVQPDNVWYAGVTEADVPELLASHLEQGRPVERLLMPDIPWE